MKKALRLIALLLALVLALQGTAVAAAPERPGAVKAPGDPAQPEIIDPDEPTPEPIVITAGLEDGQVVYNPMQSLTVEAAQGETVLTADAITVTLGGRTVEAAEGVWPLRLERGDNTIVITAESGALRTETTLRVRFEIEVPEGWARDALAFCVEHDILNGNEYGDLQPTQNASRAQLAAMLVRLFAVRNKADLTGFRDVRSCEWYYEEMARAVAMGIYKGSDGYLQPSNLITREQAFLVLARAFGVCADSTDPMAPFPDGAQASTWASCAIAGMIEAGYIHGGSNGKLNPKGYITRQELAQVLYNALDCITDDPDELTGSRCLYTGSAAALEGRTVNGSLIMSCPDTGKLNLSALRVSGRLALHLPGVSTATLDGASDSVCLCSPIRLVLTSPVKTVLSMRDGVSITATADRAIIDGSGILNGSYSRATCVSGNLTIAQGASVKELNATANMAGSVVIVNGTADALHAKARRVTLRGSGRIGTLYKYYNDLKVECAVGSAVDRVDAGLEGAKIVAGAAPEAWYDIPTVTVTGTVTNVNATQVYGVPNGVRTVTVTYRYNGKIIRIDNNFRLTEGAKLSCSVTPVQHSNTTQDQTVDVTISYHGQNLTGQLKLRTYGKLTPLKEAQGIRPSYTYATVTSSTGIYAYSSLSGYIGSVSTDTVVRYFKTSGSSSLIETEGGKRGWVPSWAIRVAWRTYHSDSVVYSKEVMEAFVNQVHDYSSSTRYLIWCNPYTTTVNIFEGSRGNWKLIKTCECCIGAPTTPTRVGTFSLYAKTYYWSFDDTAAHRADVTRCYYVSLFDGGIAFHTRLYYTGTSTYASSALSAENSHGCVRCPDEIARFIYNQCPIGTRVVVY